MPKRLLRRRFYQQCAAVFWAIYHAALTVFNKWALSAWVILVIAFVIAFDKQSKLSEQNKSRIIDIQQSRLESCVTTYNSFHVIFTPFFPPADKRTAKQKHDLAKLDNIIAKKIKQCKKQVTPPALHPEKP